MTRIACIADSHFDETSRFEECVRIHDWIADDLVKRAPDIILHAGDVFERKSTARERLAVVRWLRRCAELAPVLMVRGNHDAIGDIALFSKLRTKHPILVEEAASVHCVSGCAVAAIAWPRKAEILARAVQYSHEASEAAAGDALRAMFRHFGTELARHDGPRIVLMHAMVRGSRVSTGQPLMGSDFEIGLDDLALLRADAYLLGHVHMGQTWRVVCNPVIYPGSPRRTAFGETEPKGYVWLDIDETGCGFETVETPATPMVLIECEWTGEAMRLEGFDLNSLRGADVRLRYRCAADCRDAAGATARGMKAEMFQCGAATVKLEEEVVPTNRARLPEVSRARTLPAKLELLWAHRGFEPEPERRAALLAKLGELT